MPILAGWLTGEQVPQEIIEQTLTAMGQVLERYGGQSARTLHPGAGLIAFSDAAYAMQQNDDPPVLDWVPDRRTLVYRRPLSGMHPLYYMVDWPAQGNLLFASEIKALLAVGAPRRLHIAALDTLLRYGFIPAPWTIFKAIQIVPAGSILRWQRAKTVLNHATDYHFDDPTSGEETSQASVHTLLDKTCAHLLPPHEQLVTLTGGNHASALATLLTAGHTTSPFTIVSLGYRKYAHSKAWDQTEQIAQACQRPFLTIDGVDQPEFWAATLTGLEAPAANSRPLALHQLLHTAAVETGARVAMSGLGGHTLLGPSLSQPTTGSASATWTLLEQYSHLLVNQSQKNLPLWSPDIAHLLEKEEPWEQTLHARKLARRATQFATPEQGLYYLDLHLRLPDFFVHTMHQLAMQERMVVRSPYLTAHALDILTCLPAMLGDKVAKEHVLAILAQQHIPV